MDAWCALRADPVAWLLSGEACNLHWRVLVELFGRPHSSPAVLRARGAASVNEPVATLLKELHPDGAWTTTAADWRIYSGPGWRLVAAVQWGADPTDPRIQAALGQLLARSLGDGGFTGRKGDPPAPMLTARLVQAAAYLGWWRQQRLAEALAWLDEVALRRGGTDRATLVTATAVLDALTESGEERRSSLRQRAVRAVLDGLQVSVKTALKAGFPNLLRTDAVEMLWALARAGASFDGRVQPALRRLQLSADEQGRWRRQAAVPASLPLGRSGRPVVGSASRWITLRATVALMRYAEEAGLPRLFPRPP